MIQNDHKLNYSNIINRLHNVICTNSHFWTFLKCRNESDNAMQIFKKPIVNFSADAYYYLIGDNSI